MCVVITGWPYFSVRLIMPLKQASCIFATRNSSFVDKGFKRMLVAESCVCGFMFTRQCRVDYIEA